MSASLTEIVPPGVRAFDALINHRIAAAGNGADVDRWLTAKLTIKRRLADLPAAVVNREAWDAMERLEATPSAR